MKFALRKTLASGLTVLMLGSAAMPLNASTSDESRRRSNPERSTQSKKIAPDPTPTPPVSGVPGSTGPTTTPSPAPPPEKSFADVTKDFESIKGLFTVYRKEDKT